MDKYIQMHFECLKSLVDSQNLVEVILDYIGGWYSLSDLPSALHLFAEARLSFSLFLQ